MLKDNDVTKIKKEFLMLLFSSINENITVLMTDIMESSIFSALQMFCSVTKFNCIITGSEKDQNIKTNQRQLLHTSEL